MSYVGSSAAVIPVGFSGVNSQSFNGDGSTVAFTLNRPVSAVNAIEVMVNNVQQSPYDGSYSVSSTTLTFSAAPSSGTANIYVVYRDFPVGSITDTGAVQKTGDTMTGNLIVDANVGIGTSSPSVKLDVVGSTTSGLRLRSSSGASNGFNIYNDSGTDTASLINFYSGPMVFGTGNTERARIDSSGNVGIGTASPSGKLHVESSSVADLIEILKSTDAVNGRSVIYMASAKNSAGTQSNVSMEAQSVSGANADLVFRTSGSNVTAGTERMRIDSSGNLLVGTTSANGTEKFNVTSASTEVAFFQNSSNTSGYSGIRSNIGSGGSNTSTWHFRGETRGYASYYLYGNGTTSYSSDIRLKKNVQTARGYLEDLNKLRVVKYQWKGEDPDCQQVELGLIAQEVEEVFPNLIQEHEVEGVGNIKHIKQSVLPFMMLKAIQEQQAIIEALTARVMALEGQP